MCRCDNSGCLKRYCVCFAAGGICHDGCKCKNCANDEATAERKAARDKAIAAMMAKKRDAFEQRVGVGEGGEQILHTIGCNCKKSGCRKRYCECYQAGVACHEKCKCFGCANPAGQNPRSRDSSLIPVAKVGGGGGGAIPAAASRSVARVLRLERLARQPRVDPRARARAVAGMADLLSAAAVADGGSLLSLDGSSPPKGAPSSLDVFAAAAAASPRAKTAGPWQRRRDRTAAGAMEARRGVCCPLAKGALAGTPAPAPAVAATPPDAMAKAPLETPAAIGSTGMMPPSAGTAPAAARRGGEGPRQGRRRQGRQGRRPVAARRAAALAA